MTTYNAAELEVYQLWMLQAQKKATKRAQSRVKKWLKANPNWKAADLRNATIGIVNEVVGEYGEYASSVACDLYDACMGMDFPRAEMWQGDNSKKFEKAVRYQLDKALKGDDGGFVAAVGEMAHNYVRNAFNETMRQNVERDRSSRKGKVAYARVATGARTCTYCMMLASRGFVYHSESSAEAGDHRMCDCLIVPGRPGQDGIEGIDLKAQYDCWRDMEALDAYAAAHPDEFDAKEVERRKQEIMGRYDGLTLSDEPGEVRKHVANSGGPSAWYEARSRMGRYYDAEANAMA